jgi:hypothetical protein
VNCLEFRRSVGANPHNTDGALLAHRAQCAACEHYAQETLRLDGVIKRVLEIPVPQASQVSRSRQIQSAAKAPRMRWYAMAASLLLALSIAGGALWFLGYPRDSLAKDVVAHLAHEPYALVTTDARVSAELLDGALRAKGMHLVQPMSDVSYLKSCPVRGHFIPHIVVQTESGPVTVLLLVNETVKSIERFDEQNYHGVLVPMQRGALAVIATDRGLAETVAAKVNAAIAFN